LHLMAIEFVLNMSVLEKLFSIGARSTFRRRNVNDLS
jgi:hypothetical protein